MSLKYVFFYYVLNNSNITGLNFDFDTSKFSEKIIFKFNYEKFDFVSLVYVSLGAYLFDRVNKSSWFHVLFF